MISPYSHIYRLLIILSVAGVGFFWFKGFFVPQSWDQDLFYRVDALEDLKQQSLRHGGNESCAASACHANQQQASHDERVNALLHGGHKGLACENCHGPVSLHATDGNRIHAASVDKQPGLCLGCHAPLISRPDRFPQFSVEHIGHWYFDVDKTSECIKCHDPHEPGLMPAKAIAEENVQASAGQVPEKSHAQFDVR